MTEPRCGGRRLLGLLVLSAWPALVVAQQEPKPTPAAAEEGFSAVTPEMAAVRAVFDRYRAALIAGDGHEAVALVDQETFVYFETLRSLALRGAREQLEQKRFVERLLVVTLREMLTVEELRELTLEELISRATGEGWLSAEAVGQLGIGEVEIEGDRARAEALSAAGLSLSQEGLEPLWYTFRREGESWRFEFASLVASLDVLVTSFTSQLGADDEALIFMLVEGLTGEAVLPSVWEPPGVQENGSEAGDSAEGREG